MMRNCDTEPDNIESDTYTFGHISMDANLHFTEEFWNRFSFTRHTIFKKQRKIFFSNENYVVNIIKSWHGEFLCNKSIRCRERRVLVGGSCQIIGRSDRVDMSPFMDGSEVDSITVVSLVLDHELIRNVARSVSIYDVVDLYIPTKIAFYDHTLFKIVSDLEKEAKRNRLFSRAICEILVYKIAVHLIKNHGSIEMKAPHKKHTRHSFDNVVTYIHKNFDKDLSIAVLAKVANLSCYHFLRLFKEAMNISPHQYVIKCRIDKAKNYLNKTEWSVLRISLELGFQSQGHFCTIFKRFIGVTPTEYRRVVKDNIIFHPFNEEAPQ